MKYILCIFNVNKQLKKGSTRVFFYFDKTTEQVAIIQLETILLIYKDCKKSTFRSWKPCRMHFFTSSQCFWMALTLQNLKLCGNLEFSWYSCNILRYWMDRESTKVTVMSRWPLYKDNRYVQVWLYIHTITDQFILP
jgi:hypothetical protein